MGTAQGIRPAALQKVTSQDLAEFISVCISPIAQRPHARQLLKHSFFDSIRCCRSALQLGMASLARSAGASADFLTSSSMMNPANLASLEQPFSAPSSVAGDQLSGEPASPQSWTA